MKEKVMLVTSNIILCKIFNMKYFFSQKWSEQEVSAMFTLLFQ